MSLIASRMINRDDFPILKHESVALFHPSLKYLATVRQTQSPKEVGSGDNNGLEKHYSTALR